MRLFLDEAFFQYCVLGINGLHLLGSQSLEKTVALNVLHKTDSVSVRMFGPFLSYGPYSLKRTMFVLFGAVSILVLSLKSFSVVTKFLILSYKSVTSFMDKLCIYFFRKVFFPCLKQKCYVFVEKDYSSVFQNNKK